MTKPEDTTAAEFSVGFALATKLRALAGNERERSAIERLKEGHGSEGDMRVAAAVLVQAGEWDTASMLMRMVVWNAEDGKEKTT